MTQQNETPNLAETLAREMKQPILMLDAPESSIRRAALPPGWTLQEKDEANLQKTPRRKIANVVLLDADSFIEYVKRHGSLTDSTIWCETDYKLGKVNFKAIINDHGSDEANPAWRDHTAKYSPEFSEEWARWIASNNKAFSQTDFAKFIDDNLKDVASQEGDGMPSGAQMLEMAISFEANQDMRFKSAIRLQSGGVQMQFVQDDDAQTIEKMQMFDRFAIGIPVFWSSDAYKIEARLRYRIRDGKLHFWYELIRQDKTLEAATKTIIATVREKTGSPFFFGEPFAQR